MAIGPDTVLLLKDKPLSDGGRVYKLVVSQSGGEVVFPMIATSYAKAGQEAHGAMGALADWIERNTAAKVEVIA